MGKDLHLFKNLLNFEYGEPINFSTNNPPIILINREKCGWIERNDKAKSFLFIFFMILFI